MARHRITGENVRREKNKGGRQGLLLKVIIALIALSVIGTVICIIFTVLRVAVEAMVIAGGVLVVLVLIGIVSYNAVRYKYDAHRYKNKLDRQSKV